MPLHADDIRAALAGGDVRGAEVAETTLGTVARVPLGSVLDALRALRAAGFESLVDLDGTDTGELVELTYRVRSYAHGTEAYVKTTIAYGGELLSAWEVYPAALLPERETAELLGLTLAEHPNPKRLLTTDGVEPLLRKSVEIRAREEVRFS
ncbi:MAG: hypothetical protein Kow0067_02210 [Coriobacteriia bacterium]